ncbi:MAG: sugar ABC transporter substrate-binding protein [Eubacteriales bacterium]|nr:sugar ABC transporter substrate-binding protein [Eubacteriales bacterium]
MTNFKKFAAMALAGAMTVGMMAGCGGGATAEAPTGSAAGSGTSASSEGSKGTITVITMALNSDFWHEVQAGAILAGEELGYEIKVLGPNDETNTQEQINEVLDAQNYSDAICICATDPDSMQSTIADAHAADIPIITFANPLTDESAYDAYTGTNDAAAGRGLGDYIAETQGKDVKLAIIRGVAGAITHDQRANGIAEGVEAGGGEVVDEQPADSDRAKAVTVAENLIQANPDINAIAATSDEMALGAYEAIKSSGLTDRIKVYGFDASLGGLESIIAGELTADAAQQPIQMGYDSVVLATKVLNGETVEKENEVPYDMIDQSNAEEFYNNSIQSLRDAGFDY